VWASHPSGHALTNFACEQMISAKERPSSNQLAHGCCVPGAWQISIGLVMKAPGKSAVRLLQNAPHLVHDLAFVVPNYDWW